MNTMTPETIGHIVTQGGKPCALRNAALTWRGGVLVPAEKGETVVFFGTPRDAKRAIARTTCILAKLKGSMIGDWALLSPFFSGDPYEIVPLTRSHIARADAREIPNPEIPNPK